MIIAKDKCFNVIAPWASIYNLLIPTKAVSQEFMAIDWSKRGENKLLIGSKLELENLIFKSLFQRRPRKAP